MSKLPILLHVHTYISSLSSICLLDDYKHGLNNVTEREIIMSKLLAVLCITVFLFLLSLLWEYDGGKCYVIDYVNSYVLSKKIKFEFQERNEIIRIFTSLNVGLQIVGDRNIFITLYK